MAATRAGNPQGGSGSHNLFSDPSHGGASGAMDAGLMSLFQQMIALQTQNLSLITQGGQPSGGNLACLRNLAASPVAACEVPGLSIVDAPHPQPALQLAVAPQLPLAPHPQPAWTPPHTPPQASIVVEYASAPQAEDAIDSQAQTPQAEGAIDSQAQTPQDDGIELQIDATGSHVEQPGSLAKSVLADYLNMELEARKAARRPRAQQEDLACEASAPEAKRPNAITHEACTLAAKRPRPKVPQDAYEALTPAASSGQAALAPAASMERCASAPEASINDGKSAAKQRRGPKQRAPPKRVLLQRQSSLRVGGT